jgi:hypothetical protein
MLVKIRFKKGPKVARRRGKNRQVASAVAGLLTPAGVISLFLALWRVAADLSWTNSFAIPSGLFSHWQVWLGTAALLQGCAHMLNRYGKGADSATS